MRSNYVFFCLLISLFSQLIVGKGKQKRQSGPNAHLLKETSAEATASFRNQLPALEWFNSKTCHALSPTKDIDLDGGVNCLGITKTPPNIIYPDDAEEHFLEIENTLAKWKQKKEHYPHRAANYGGPWVENHWITHFESLLFGGNETNTMVRRTESPPKCLREYFGPFIPIMIPWVDRWVLNRYSPPQGLADDVKKILRQNVLYVTVSQNDIGLSDIIDLSQFPNVLVLSAGGYGHVAIPLMKEEQKPIIHNRPSVADRPILLSFAGTLGHSPDRMRSHMMDILSKRSKACHGTIGKFHENASCVLYQGGAWRELMAVTKVSLCPRGYGRTSYRVSETVQLGFVPLHVWLDQPWIPYPETVFPKLGYSTSLKNLQKLSEFLMLKSSIPEIEAKEAFALSVSKSHFSYAGVMDQIAKFLISPSLSLPGHLDLTGVGSDLRCTALPKSPRDAEGTVELSLLS